MKDYIIYYDITRDDIILEVWGASTKHPDVTYSFNSWWKSEGKNPLYEYSDRFEKINMVQWLLHIASKQMFAIVTLDILNIVNEYLI